MVHSVLRKKNKTPTEKQHQQPNFITIKSKTNIPRDLFIH